MPAVKPVQAGDANLNCLIAPRWHFKEIRIEVHPIGNLRYSGPSSYSVSNKIADTSRFLLPVTIPNNDTSGIEIKIYTDGYNHYSPQLFFVTTSDTVKIFNSKPIPASPLPNSVGTPDATWRDASMTPEELFENRRGDTIQIPETSYPTLRVGEAFWA
jgi:hypothetical protein